MQRARCQNRLPMGIIGQNKSDLRNFFDWSDRKMVGPVIRMKSGLILQESGRKKCKRFCEIICRPAWHEIRGRVTPDSDSACTLERHPARRQVTYFAGNGTAFDSDTVRFLPAENRAEPLSIGRFEEAFARCTSTTCHGRRNRNANPRRTEPGPACS